MELFINEFSPYIYLKRNMQNITGDYKQFKSWRKLGARNNEFPQGRDEAFYRGFESLKITNVIVAQ